MAAVNGKWKLVALENFDAYLAAVGVEGEAKEKALQFLTPTNNISQDIALDGDSLSITTTTPLAPIEVKATLGTQFDSRYLDGREIKTLFSVSGDTLVEEVTGAFSTTITRAVEGGQMVMTMKCGDVTSTRRYDKI